MDGYAPRALKDSVRPRRLLGASGRPLNFTVRCRSISVSTPKIIERVFALSADVRYVAVRINDALDLQQRAELSNASASESDRYEELLVNPTVLSLTRERGRIDCGGLEFVLVRYGNFFQLVHPIVGGHISIAISPTADPLSLLEPIRRILAQEQLLPASNNRWRGP